MEQNQNPNEQGQSQAAPDGQSQSNSENPGSETPIISAEKEEPTAPYLIKSPYRFNTMQ